MKSIRLICDNEKMLMLLTTFSQCYLRSDKFHSLFYLFFSSQEQILKGLLNIPFRLEESWATRWSGPIKSSAVLTLHWFSCKFHTETSGPCGRCWTPASDVLSHRLQEGEWKTSQRERPDSQKPSGAFFVLLSRYSWDSTFEHQMTTIARTSQQASLPAVCVSLWLFPISWSVAVLCCFPTEISRLTLVGLLTNGIWPLFPLTKTTFLTAECPMASSRWDLVRKCDGMKKSPQWRATWKRVRWWPLFFLVGL